MKKSKGNNVTYQWLKSQDRVIAGLIPLPWLYIYILMHLNTGREK